MAPMAEWSFLKSRKLVLESVAMTEQVVQPRRAGSFFKGPLGHQAAPSPDLDTSARLIAPAHYA
jgi:hypothetical protein